jgi:flagellar motility protein MotE (MotC chaperone)
MKTIEKNRSSRILPLAVPVMLALLTVRTDAADAEVAAAASVSDEIKTFCTNIADPARDQRYLIQKQKLADLQADIDERIKVLEARRAEYEDWLTRRNEFLKRAEAGLVEIYAKMDSDSAAKQLQIVDANVAAALIMKLEPGKASEILNEMNPESAAKLAGIIASAVDPTTSRNPS